MRILDIKPYRRNAKKHDETQIANVMQSIREFGVVQPIVVDKTGVIVIGHCRYEALKRLGYDELTEDMVKVVDLSEEEAEKLRLLDNKLNESDWDTSVLKDLVPTLDMEKWDVDFGIPTDVVLSWDDIEEISEENYEQPRKTMLECGNCGHKDIKAHFKKVAK